MESTTFTWWILYSFHVVKTLEYLQRKYYTQFQINNINSNNNKEILPYYKNGILYIPECGSNDKKFRQKYIDIGNELLLKNDKEIIKIDLRNNVGGKSAAMIGSLLPLLNMSNKQTFTLSLCKTRTKFIKHLIKKNNCVIDLINDNETAYGTNLKLEKCKKIIVYINEHTASAAESTVIGLMSLRDIIDIKFVGKKTAGYTTSIKSFKLSNGGYLEIPIGFMTDVYENIYENGVSL